MNEVTPDKEAMIDLEKAALVVPLGATTPGQRTSMDGTTIIDPTEFFDFFYNFTAWPTNGLRLSESADRQGYSSNLVKFFEGLPGSFATEADVMPYAEDACKPPFGEVIAVGPPGEADTEDPGELTLTDIRQGIRS
jgi:hypothetical protein